MMQVLWLFLFFPILAAAANTRPLRYKRCKQLHHPVHASADFHYRMAEDQDTHEWFTYDTVKAGNDKMIDAKKAAEVVHGFFYGKDSLGCYLTNRGKAAAKTNAITLYDEKGPKESYSLHRKGGCYLAECPDFIVEDVRISWIYEDRQD